MSKLPAEVIAKALDSHTAILGKTGSGKSNTAKWMSEQLMDRGERVCAVDPTGTWWGMRLKPDGKPSKYKPIIFGGRHADIAILPEHGAAIAEAVATSNDSSIIDLREMTVGGRTKFFAAFAEALLRLNRGKLNLMLDEAHLFAPQGRVNDPQSGIMLNATNNLVSLGRGNGIRVTMISQRPAKLHKDSLTQCETLIAMRLIAPQDRAAINDWVGEWGDVSRGKEIVSSLPSMSVGSAWFWSPEQNYLEKVAFPKVKTLDTGQQDESNSHMLTLKIDIAEVTARLEGIAAEVIANDPKKLRSRIAELEGALRQAKAAPAGADSQQVEDARQDGFTAGWDAGVKGGYTTGWDAGYLKGVEDMGIELGQMVLTFSADFAMAANKKRGEADVPAPDTEGVTVMKGRDAGKTTSQAALLPLPRETIEVKARSIGKTDVREVTQAMRDSGITGPQGRILTSLKVWQTLGHQQVTKPMLAALAGYSAGSGGFNNLLSGLRAASRIDYPSPGKVSLLIDWNSISFDEAFAMFQTNISVPQSKILNAVASGKAYTKPQVAEMSGYSAGSGGFNNLLSSLRTMDLITYPEKGQVQLTDWALQLVMKNGSF